MSRCRFRYTVRLDGKPVQNARVYVYEVGTTDDPGDVYLASSGGSAVASIVTNAQGEVNGYKTKHSDIDVKVTDNSNAAYFPSVPSRTLDFADFTETVAVLPPTNEIGRFGAVGIDIRDFGAHCDYGASGADTDAFLAAVDYAKYSGETTNIVILVPDGTLLDETIDLYQYFTIQGIGGHNQNADPDWNLDFNGQPMAVIKSTATPAFRHYETDAFPTGGVTFRDAGVIAPKTCFYGRSSTNNVFDNSPMRALASDSVNEAPIKLSNTFWNYFLPGARVSSSDRTYPSVLLIGESPGPVNSTYLTFFDYVIFARGMVRYDQRVVLGGPLLGQIYFDYCQWENADGQMQFVNTISGTPNQPLSGGLVMRRGSSTDIGAGFAGALHIGAGFDQISNIVLDHADEGYFWPWLNSTPDVDAVDFRGSSNSSDTWNRGAGVVRSLNFPRQERSLGIRRVVYDDNVSQTYPIFAQDQNKAIFAARGSPGANGLVEWIANGPRVIFSTVTPNSNVVGSQGDICIYRGGGAGTTLWVKESGSNSNTGWVGK